MNNPIQNVGHHNPANIIYWSVIEMIYFDSGEVYGRVRFIGTESECEQWTKEELKNHYCHLEFPACFENKKIIQINLNIIATTKPCTIYGVGPSNLIGKS